MRKAEEGRADAPRLALMSAHFSRRSQLVTLVPCKQPSKGTLYLQTWHRRASAAAGENGVNFGKSWENPDTRPALLSPAYSPLTRSDAQDEAQPQQEQLHPEFSAVPSPARRSLE